MDGRARCAWAHTPLSIEYHDHEWGVPVHDDRVLFERSSMRAVPPRTPDSDVLSRDLLKRGFKFVGSTICYAFMQAIGMVNDHTVDCFRFREVSARRKRR